MVAKIEFISIRTTTDKEDEAKMLSKNLVQKKLAACVHIIPNVESFYSWNNAVESDREFIIEIKSLKTLFKTIEAEIKQTISYECPQIISFNIDQISEDYKAWFKDVCHE